MNNPPPPVVWAACLLPGAIVFGGAIWYFLWEYLWAPREVPAPLYVFEEDGVGTYEEPETYYVPSEEDITHV